ncbi:peptidase domain-containing ABC transporter [Butyrivibrio sp. WCE2006]|uniref:peptidase domain-containing ABC transporter n=1 Tax=Butyrivibrio sp. WCE2006 TaxID=1410611 RepID=UPI0005D23DCD|nr:ATP-binding cassette domain-containing protein [Butyrivibrio sp. WCE2006]
MLVGLRRMQINIAPQRSEFGSACLSMLSGFYGKTISLMEAAKLCCVSKNGCTFEQLRDGAQYIGFNCEILDADYGIISKRNEPCIVMLDSDYAVFYKLKGRKAILCTPDKGLVKIDIDDFKEALSSKMLYISPSGESGIKSIEYLSPAKYIFSILAETKKSYLFISCLLLTSISLLFFSVQYFISEFTDTYYASNYENSKPFIYCVYILIILLILLIVFEVFQTIVFPKLSENIATICRKNFVWSSLNLPMFFYSIRSDGYFMESVLQAVRTGYFLSKQIVELIIRPFFAAVCLLFIARVSVIACILVILSYIVMSIATYINARLEDETEEIVFYKDSKAEGFLYDGLKAIRSIKNSGSEFIFFREYFGLNLDTSKEQKKFDIIEGSFNGFPTLVANITKMILLMLGIISIIYSKVTYGGLIFIIGIYEISQEYIKAAIYSRKVLITINNKLKNLADIFSSAKDDENGVPAENVSYNKLKGNIEIKGVSFGYNKYSREILHDISMTIPSGNSIAIVGATGCGKTTLKQLICGRYDPWKGEILFDGVSSGDIPEDVRLSSISSVDQKIGIFGDTIMNNIKMWDSTQLDADAILAAKDAQINECIISRKNGYNYVMSDNGTDFSGGERQRIEIARALSMDPSILVLDEATSSLDTIVEKRIVEHIRQRGITTIVIAHRLSTIRQCDKIYVMENGRIISSGTHEELMEKCELYHELVTVE